MLMKNRKKKSFRYVEDRETNKRGQNNEKT